MEPEKLIPQSVLDSLMIGHENLPIHQELNQLEDMWEEAQANCNWGNMESAWKEMESNNIANSGFTSYKPMSIDEFCSFWQNMWPQEEFKETDYLFDQENPFINQPNLQESLTHSLSSGDIKQSIHITEAMILQSPTSPEAWVLLGKLNAENDEDNQSLSALKRGYELDPYSEEAMLALGIGLINAKQPERAMQTLITWLHSSPSFQHLSSSNSDLKEQTIDLFIQASSLKPQDSSLHQILGSIYFMMKEYDLAVSAFENSVALDPTNYYSWNRLGAALAHQGQNEQAIQAYHKALELRPKYVRAWANIGIAHANLDKMVEACQFYLCALYLNPKAFHVWNYLVTALTCLSKK